MTRFAVVVVARSRRGNKPLRLKRSGLQSPPPDAEGYKVKQPASVTHHLLMGGSVRVGQAYLRFCGEQGLRCRSSKNKIDDTALALLYLTLHDDDRA